jgi:rhodanese-related sulfurtransferase
MRIFNHFFRLAALLVCFTFFSAQPKAKDNYQCIPCGHSCDTKIHNGPGKCPDCGMALVKSSSITFKTIQPAAICQYIQQHPKSILLDVRSPEEFAGKADPDPGRLKNAINIPIEEVETRIAELEPYKNSEIIVYCSHSHRSPQVAWLLTQKGFKQVQNMSGGMSTLADKSCKEN